MRRRSDSQERLETWSAHRSVIRHRVTKDEKPPVLKAFILITAISSTILFVTLHSINYFLKG